ncbi:PREDICTED: protein FAM214A-like [Branchiostoma belcheri]|uniref:Protein FAM214A-like n=1 Tax=Branchiostoma belcheri TaxID=7741 RepID=A0A6P5AS90_BRABE|nr:PREDICTED: protein FAM214A-like [Branchiostoma belcheri]
MKPKDGLDSSEMEEEEVDPYELFVDIGMLVTDGRVPEPSLKGRTEGKHCPPPAGSAAHMCGETDSKCVKAMQLKSQMFLLWRNDIPMSVEVLLCPQCCYEEMAADVETLASSYPQSAILLEQWTIHMVAKRPCGGRDTPRTLLQAVRSYIHFSQLSAWLSQTHGQAPKNVLYRVCAPGEGYNAQFLEQPEIHHFPVPSLPPSRGLKVTVAYLPRKERIPNPRCSLEHHLKQPKSASTVLEQREHDITEHSTTKRAVPESPKPTERVRETRIHSPDEKPNTPSFPPTTSASCSQNSVGSQSGEGIRPGLREDHKRLQHSSNSGSSSSETTPCNSPLSRPSHLQLQICQNSPKLEPFKFPNLTSTPNQDAATTTNHLLTPFDFSQSEKEQRSPKVLMTTWDQLPKLYQPLVPERETTQQTQNDFCLSEDSGISDSGKDKSCLFNTPDWKLRRLSIESDETTPNAKSKMAVPSEKDQVVANIASQVERRMSPAELECFLQTLATKKGRHDDRLKSQNAKASTSTSKKESSIQHVPEKSPEKHDSSLKPSGIPWFLGDEELRISEHRDKSKRRVSESEQFVWERQDNLVSRTSSFQPEEVVVQEQNDCNFLEDSLGSPNDLSSRTLDEEAPNGLSIPEKVATAHKSHQKAEGESSQEVDEILPKKRAREAVWAIRSPTDRPAFLPGFAKSKSLLKDVIKRPAKVAEEDAELLARAASAQPIPTPDEKAKFRRSLDSCTDYVFHPKTGLPVNSSPAPPRRSQTSESFDFDDSLIVKQPNTWMRNSTSCGRLDTAALASLSDHKKVLSTSAPACAGMSLLGNFEESVLNGRLEPLGTVEGFTAELGASSAHGTFCPRHVKMNVQAEFYGVSDDHAPSPYSGIISLDGLGKKGYQVPKKGTLQLTLFNPHRTVVKMFVVQYDLVDMPPNCQTFLRQRTYYVPAHSTSQDIKAEGLTPRYVVHLRFASSKSGRIYLHKDIRLLFARQRYDVDAGMTNYELKSFTEVPKNPRFSPKK